MPLYESNVFIGKKITPNVLERLKLDCLNFFEDPQIYLPFQCLLRIKIVYQIKRETPQRQPNHMKQD